MSHNTGLWPKICFTSPMIWSEKKRDMPVPKLENRRYIRHPVDVPISCQLDRRPRKNNTVLKDVSTGGVSFVTAQPVEPGAMVNITIDLVHPPFTASARVQWCHPEGDRFLVGVSFVASEDRYQARMVEQLCYIETYRKETLEKDGRSLSPQEAAMEWIARYADHFPNFEKK